MSVNVTAVLLRRIPGLQIYYHGIYTYLHRCSVWSY